MVRVTLDVILAPVTVAWKWGVVAEWRRHLSDHAGLSAGPVGTVPRDARLLTPATFKSLKPEALVDLRARFRALEEAYGVPPAAGDWPPGGQDGYVRPIGPGGLPPGHPALVALDAAAPPLPTDGDAGAESRGGSGAARRPPTGAPHAASTVPLVEGLALWTGGPYGHDSGLVEGLEG